MDRLDIDVVWEYLRDGDVETALYRLMEALEREGDTSVAEDFKIQISVKDGAGTLYNFRGETPQEVAGQVEAAKTLAAFTPAIAVLEIEQAKVTQSTLAAPAPVAAPPVSVPAVVAEAAAAAAAVTPPSVAPPTVETPKAAPTIKEPNAPRSDKQGALIIKLGGTDNPAYTKAQAAAYIDQLIAAKKS